MNFGISVKVWNPRTGACLRSIDAGYGLCAVWAPGNRHAVLGTKVPPTHCVQDSP